MQTPQLVTAHNAITETATSDAIYVSDCQKLVVDFTEGGTVNNRSGVLTVTGSVDGSDYHAFNMLIDNVANTNGQTITRVASKTRATAGSDILALDLSAFHFQSIKVTVTITDGAAPTGNFTVRVLKVYENTL